jgi:hypothetical protein
LSILVIADTHGDIDHHKLNNNFVKRMCNDEYPQYVIVCGDFGFLWSNKPDESEKYWLKWVDSKPWITLFIDGNHENHPRLQSLPQVTMFNAPVGKVTDTIFHLRRGEVYTIENKTFFAFGGAQSHDIQYRIEGVSWWKEEEPSYPEYLHGIDSLEKVGYTIDYVLTHTCPSIITKNLFCENTDSTTKLLEAYKEKIICRKWLFGHWHIDRRMDDIFLALYDRGFFIP